VVNVANAVLGGGGSRDAHQRDPVKRGLTYGANSSFSRQKTPESSPSRRSRNRRRPARPYRSHSTKRRASQKRPDRDRLGERKTYLTGSFAVGVATAQGVLGRVVPAILYGRGASEIGEYVGKVEAVTPDSARSALNKASRNGPGNRSRRRCEGDQEQATKFGDVTVIASEDLDLNAPTW
jgi:zinc protease